MSNDTSTVDSPVNEATDNEAEETVTIDVELIPGTKVTLKGKERSKRNSDEKYLLLRPQIEPKDLVKFLSTKLNEGGNLVFEGAILRELVYPAANEATSVAFVVDPSTGQPKFYEEKWVEAFWDSFVTSDRRKGGGLTIKDLHNQLNAIQPVFTAKVQEVTAQSLAYTEALEAAVKNRTAAPNKSEFVDEALSNEVKQLLLQVTELQQKIEAKSRPGGGRPKGSKKAKK